jgi:hypothetical protein
VGKGRGGGGGFREGPTAFKFVDGVNESVDGFNVQVVGGFIQNDNVSGAQGKLRKHHP